MFFSKLFKDNKRVVAKRFKAYNDDLLSDDELEEFNKLKEEIWGSLPDSLKKNMFDKDNKKYFNEFCEEVVEDFGLEFIEFKEEMYCHAINGQWEDFGWSDVMEADLIVGNVSALKTHYNKEYKELLKDGDVRIVADGNPFEYLLQGVDSVLTFDGDYDRLEELAIKTGREGYYFDTRAYLQCCEFSNYDEEKDTALMKVVVLARVECLDEY